MIRSEFVFMLGGEIEDEAIEAEQSVELQEGRLANRGQRDLRAATVAMSQAEKHLTDANPEEALEAERAAVAALQRAFARDRYILRSLATRTPLDRARRLTGAIARCDRLAAPAARAREDNRRAREVTDLLQGLGDLSSDAVSSDVERRNRLSVLAEMSLRSDADSAALRQTATNLQGLADAWTALDARERVRQLDAITADVSAEARGRWPIRRRRSDSLDDDGTFTTLDRNRDRDSRLRRSCRDARRSNASTPRPRRAGWSVDGFAGIERRHDQTRGRRARRRGSAARSGTGVRDRQRARRRSAGDDRRGRPVSGRRVSRSGAGVHGHGVEQASVRTSVSLQ